MRSQTPIRQPHQLKTIQWTTFFDSNKMAEQQAENIDLQCNEASDLSEVFKMTERQTILNSETSW